MYTPTQFREPRPEVLMQAVRDIQLSTMVTATADGYHATHAPMVLKERDGVVTLESHIARPNAHWTVLEKPVASLAVFQGPEAYVSPSWYESKRLHGKVVPTWNYIAVHAHGTLEAVQDPDWLLAHLDDLTTANEAEREHPWAVSDAPEDYVRNLTRAIVGLRFVVERFEGSWKMIQHKTEGDRAGTIAGLADSTQPGAQAVAEVMRELEAGRTGR